MLKPHGDYYQAADHLEWWETALLIFLVALSAGLMVLFVSAIAWAAWSLLQRVFGS